MSVSTLDETGSVIEPSNEEQQARADLCYAIESRIRANLAVGREEAWELCKNLYDFNEQNGWTALGYEQQKEWLAQPEIGLTATQFYRYVRRYRELVINRQIPQASLVELEPSKLDVVMPTIEQGKTKLADVLEDVKVLGARDLREKYGITRALKPPETIDGTAKTVEVDAEPVRADKVEQKPVEPFLDSAAVVDSYVMLGGDKRKAQRNFTKLMDQHPFFAALGVVQRYVDKQEPMPDQPEAVQAWKVICNALEIAFVD